MEIFISYPNAKMFYKVGDKYFAHNAKTHAESYSRQSGIKLEEVYNPANAETKTSDKAEKVKKEKTSVNPEKPAE